MSLFHYPDVTYGQFISAEKIGVVMMAEGAFLPVSDGTVCLLAVSAVVSSFQDDDFKVTVFQKFMFADCPVETIPEIIRNYGGNLTDFHRQPDDFSDMLLLGHLFDRVYHFEDDSKFMHGNLWNCRSAVFPFG